MLTVQITPRKIEVVLIDRWGALGLAMVMYLKGTEYTNLKLIRLKLNAMNTYLSIAMAAMVNTEAMMDMCVIKLVTLQK